MPTARVDKRNILVGQWGSGAVWGQYLNSYGVLKEFPLPPFCKEISPRILPQRSTQHQVRLGLTRATATPPARSIKPDQGHQGRQRHAGTYLQYFVPGHLNHFFLVHALVYSLVGTRPKLFFVLNKNKNKPKTSRHNKEQHMLDQGDSSPHILKGTHNYKHKGSRSH